MKVNYKLNFIIGVNNISQKLEFRLQNWNYSIEIEFISYDSSNFKISKLLASSWKLVFQSKNLVNFTLRVLWILLFNIFFNIFSWINSFLELKIIYFCFTRLLETLGISTFEKVRIMAYN